LQVSLPMPNAASTLPSLSSPASPPRTVAATDRVFAVGDLLNGVYEIRAVLGVGGMGEVYEAEDHFLRRRVAIKVHRPGRSHVSLRSEAQALAAINHPSMVGVHGHGVHRGIPYIVMERVLGPTLFDHIEQCRARHERFSIAEVVAILAPLAEGLAAVHAAGIAHSDVKPANIMLEPRGRVVLLDLGIFLPEFAASIEELTAGTAEYMAPEAIAGEIAPGDAYLIDVYAFGIIAFELLLGAVPFTDTTPVQVLGHHLCSPPPDLGRRRPDLSPRMCALIRSLLEKHPHERPHDLLSVAAQLRSFASERSSHERSPFSVMIVEDEPAMAETLYQIVHEAAPDAVVRVHLEPERAMDAVRRKAPDLLLLDLRMPKVNGIEVAMYLRGTHSADRTTIVAVSANLEAREADVLRSLGVNHFVQKGPDLVDTLLPLVSEKSMGAETDGSPPG